MAFDDDMDKSIAWKIAVCRWLADSLELFVGRLAKKILDSFWIRLLDDETFIHLLCGILGFLLSPLLCLNFFILLFLLVLFIEDFAFYFVKFEKTAPWFFCWRVWSWGRTFDRSATTFVWRSKVFFLSLPWRLFLHFYTDLTLPQPLLFFVRYSVGWSSFFKQFRFF